MRRLTTQLGLDDCVEFAGWLEDSELRSLLSTADLCIAPDPPSPLNDVSTMAKIPEYMAMGRPIVSYDLIESRASAGDAALYAPQHRPECLGGCVDELLDDPQRRARMGLVATQRVEAALTWQHSEQALLAAYQRALSDGHSGGKRYGRRARAPVSLIRSV